MSVDVISISLGTLGGAFALVVLGIWIYFCVHCVRICAAYRKEKEKLKRNLPRQSSRHLSRQVSVTSTPSAPPPELVMEQQLPKRKTDRPHFKKTLLSNIANTPVMQRNASTPIRNHSNQYLNSQRTAQSTLTDIDRSDSFSHMDFSYFDMSGNAEEGNRNYDPPLYSDLYSHATVLPPAISPITAPPRQHRVRAEASEFSQLSSWPQLN